MLVIHERIPCAGLVHIGFADVKTRRPEGRHTAVLMSARREDIGTHGMIEGRVAVHIFAERGAVLPVVEGNGGLLADLPLGADADDIRELVERMLIVARAVRSENRMALIADGAQIPCRHAEIRRKLFSDLQVERLVERRDIVLFKDDARRLDEVADNIAQRSARQLVAGFRFLSNFFECLPISCSDCAECQLIRTL